MPQGFGPHQVGKTTLALKLSEGRNALYLESAAWVKPGFHSAREDIKPRRSFVVSSGEDRFPISQNVEAIGIRELAGMLTPMG